MTSTTERTDSSTPPGSTRPNRPPTALVATAAGVFALLAVLSAVALIGPRSKQTPPLPPIALPPDVDIRVPDFSLTDANGTSIDATMLNGRYTVMDFFFTNCPFACPGMSRQMARVQEATRGTGIRLLSISVDGNNDTPAKIREYGENIGADPSRWTLATGDPNAVATLCRDGLKLSIAADPSRTIVRDDGTEMANIDHPTRLILVGPDRRVLALASYLVDEEVDQLIQMGLRLARGLHRGG